MNITRKWMAVLLSLAMLFTIVIPVLAEAGGVTAFAAPAAEAPPGRSPGRRP